MSTSVQRGRAPAAGDGAGRGAGPLPVRQRRPGYTAVGVAMILALAAVGAWMYAQAGHKTPVVVVVGDVPAGHVIGRADLSTVDVAGAITAVAGEHLDGIVGRTAAVHLLPGTVLQRSMVTSAGPLAAGQAAVGVAVKGGQVPADGVAAGDVVDVLRVPTAGAASTGGSGTAPEAQVLVAKATVFSSRPDPAQAGGSLVTVIVPVADYASVVAAGAAGQVALVGVPSS